MSAPTAGSLTSREDADVGTWLYRVVYNACIDELRRSRRRPIPVDVSADIWDRPDRGDPEHRVITRDLVLQALAALPVEQRAAVVLIDGEGLDYDTAATVLDVAPGTVASRLSRGRAAFRRHIGRNDDDI